jgi:hypothetical protein
MRTQNRVWELFGILLFMSFLAGVYESACPAFNAESVHFLQMENGKAVFAIESGRYHFRVPTLVRNAKNEDTAK